MRHTRRGVLARGVACLGLSAGVAGCSGFRWGRERSIPVVVDNETTATRLVSTSVTTRPGESGGFTTYFDEIVEVGPHGSTEFKDGLEETDHEPTVQAMAVADSEAAAAETFPLSYDLTEVTVVVESEDRMRIDPVTE